ncbi:hypothetical protein BJY01DRAFT_211395 [Aspergillus pseudoustus]|uniref:Xylanolytic transcriptional activator regulatory domain-containing protein n=1 Tax=Aspergillus pseudoustus TaxID=1810923 RepID=A0ABR4K9A0_9EURO
MESSILPAELVTAVLQEIKAKRPICLCSYPLNDISLVERLAASPAESLSSTHLACLHGVFYFILKEFSFFQHPLRQRFNLKDLTWECERRLDTFLETYNVLGVPSFGNILALTLGVIKAQNQSKPLQACTLVSAAASHCQTLGYNHDSTHGNSSNSRRLFWSVYMLEKQLSFYFQRASVIQDFDIDTAYPVCASKYPAQPRDELFFKEIELAKVQSQIYQEAFSKESLRLSHSERDKRIGKLAMDLQFRFSRLVPVVQTYNLENLRLFNVAQETWETKYHSTFTTLLRAPPPSPPSDRDTRNDMSKPETNPGQTHIRPECFKTAREALQSYLRCSRTHQYALDNLDLPESSEVKMEREIGEFPDWTLLSALLTPFIVIALHTIASPPSLSSSEKDAQDKEKDLSLLASIVSSLEPLRSFSPATTRLHKFTSSLAKIAQGLNERRASMGPGTSQGDLFASARGSGERRSVASSIFSSGSQSETRSVFQQVLDTDVLGFVGEGEVEEVFRVLEGWMGGSLNGVEVYGGLDGVF